MMRPSVPWRLQRFCEPFGLELAMAIAILVTFTG